MTSQVDVQQSYPLSPVQRGILHRTLTGSGPMACLEQVRLTVRGRLRVAEFQRAWSRVIARHATLRTGFVWQGVDEPLQVVVPTVPSPEWHVDDLRTIRACQRRRGLADFLAADRARGFTLTAPPLSRFALLRVSETEHLFVWTVHQLVVDGWSFPILVREALGEYRAAVEGRDAALPAPAAFRDHVARLSHRDLTGAEQFWRVELAGRSAPTPLPPDVPDSPEDVVAPDDPVPPANPTAPTTPDGTTGPVRRADPPDALAEHRVELTGDDSARLYETARRQRIGLDSVLHGCWALLLSAHSGDTDVVFGATVTGRPAEDADAEHLVGPLVNTLPVRVRIDPDQPVGAWLRHLRQRRALASEFAHVPLAQIRSWTDTPAGTPLFESLVDFENYPVDNGLFTGTGDASTLSMRFEGRWSASYHPLTLLVVPGERLGLYATYDRHRLRPATVERLLAQLVLLLNQVAADSDRPVSALSPIDHGYFPAP